MFFKRLLKPRPPSQEYRNLWKHLKAKWISLLGRGNSMERTPTGIVYECVRCGAKVPSEELEMRGGETKCIVCGYRILRKVKPPVVKRIPAK
jgi:DNA-directed RNA polymerase subunit RPC12/RpoP